MQEDIKKKFRSFIGKFAAKDLQNCAENKFKGRDIKKIRKDYNLSQRCFAAMLDMSVRTLQNYEIDRYSIPGTAKSLFLFAGENVELFRKYYLTNVKDLEPYRESVNRK